MRYFLILFAVTAFIWSGIHAGSAEARENDPAHWAESSHHAQDQDSDSDTDASLDHHGCHHHCPAGTADHLTAGQQAVLFGKDVIMKAQIDHLPLAYKGMRPTQGRTLAVMQVCAGSQSFNTVNTLRVLGRWMRMVTIPNQSSVAKAYEEFDNAGRMKPSAYYDRIVDVMEELVRFTVLLRPHAVQLVDRYSERKDKDRTVETHVEKSGLATE